MHGAFSPLVIARLLLMVLAAIVATLLLYRKRITGKVRLGFLVGGVAVLGFLSSLMGPKRMDPSPLMAVRGLIKMLTKVEPAPLFVPILLLVLLAVSWVSNKSICGWGCPLGLLQELIHRVRLPKWKPPFRLWYSVRLIAFLLLIVGLTLSGLDWIGWIEPFQIFRLEFNLGVGIFLVALIGASLFIYRPWCLFLCPFGFLTSIVEQVSFFRPRIDWQICGECRLCVKACPTQAMEGFFAGETIHADCFACGACLEACPRKGALRWQGKPRVKDQA